MNSSEPVISASTRWATLLKLLTLLNRLDVIKVAHVRPDEPNTALMKHWSDYIVRTTPGVYK